MNYSFCSPNTCAVTQNDIKDNFVRGERYSPGSKGLIYEDNVDCGSDETQKLDCIEGTSKEEKVATPIQRCSNKRLHTYQESLKFERERLNTFIDWPLDWLSPSVLAKEGFYFLRKADHVACIFCTGIIGAWELGDVPKIEHKKHYGFCPFVKNQPVGNIPIDLGDLVVSIQTKDHLKVRDPAVLPVHKPPRETDYVTVESRLRTFKKWPHMVKQDPQILAEAGFFYIGISDNVRCYHCGQGLRNWEGTDDPWEEHARWYPDCEFVRVVKTDNFIKKVLQCHLNTTHQCAIAPIDSTVAASANNSSQNKKAYFTESQLEKLMTLDIPIAAIKLNFSEALVKETLRKRLETTGFPFFSLERCIHYIWKSMEHDLKEGASSRKSQDNSESSATLTELPLELQSTTTSESPSSTTSESPASTTSEPPASTTSEPPASTTSEPPASTTSEPPASTTSEPPASLTSEHLSSTRTYEHPSSVASEPPSSVTSEPQSSVTSEPPSSVTSEPPFSVTSEPPSSVTSEPPSSVTSEPPSSVTSEPPSSVTSEPPSSVTSEPPSSVTSEPPSSVTSKPPSSKTSELKSITSSTVTSKSSILMSNISIKTSSSGLTISKLKNRVALLEKEVEVLKDQRMCRVCMDQEMTLVFLPCLHMATCATCGVALKDCPICRAEIVHIIRPNIVA